MKTRARKMLNSCSDSISLKMELYCCTTVDRQMQQCGFNLWQLQNFMQRCICIRCLHSSWIWVCCWQVTAGCWLPLPAWLWTRSSCTEWFLQTRASLRTMQESSTSRFLHGSCEIKKQLNHVLITYIYIYPVKICLFANACVKVHMILVMSMILHP